MGHSNDYSRLAPGRHHIPSLRKLKKASEINQLIFPQWARICWQAASQNDFPLAMAAGAHQRKRVDGAVMGN